MFIKCNEIEISGVKVPYRIDNYVLGAIQEDYDKLETFQLKLMGWEKVDGKVQVVSEPSIECINRIFPIMVEEGYRSQDKECPYTEAEIIRMIDLPPMQMALLINEEHMKCYESKKKDETEKKPSQRRMKRQS